ncbi:MAG TPA: alpha-L-arabinofuranosidase C-terminal domain-containing protein [Blastocatellia bacterium]|nr:alpha-L-arabinofuranosidase C-terminal domain-containing protein [Blastocatellia bacterium]
MSEHLIRAARLVVVLALLAGLNAPLPAQTAAARIEIDAGKVEGRISPTLYGQFIEFMFEGVKGGMSAELVRNRSFEEPPNAIGLSRYWERYPDDRNDDYGLSFHHDDAVSYPNAPKTEGLIGGHSLRVQTGPGVVLRHGIYQSRFPVRQGLDYRGYVWLKADDYKGSVSVALEADVTGGEIYAETEIGSVSGDWKKYEFTLKPSKNDALARFVILFNGRGRLWVDQVSLLPGDAADGVRRDVLEKVRALHPAFIRWPGGNVAQDYHWQWGAGPRDERPTWINLSWKNEPEPGDIGTDEFIRFCRNVGAEPSLTVNVEGRGATAAEAAAWVEYCNGPVTSKYGAMRARNGHAEPYGVKYWEIGNEIWGDWVRGHSDATTYARNYKRYVAAMRAVDPTIKFIAVGDNNQEWNRTVLKLAGDEIDWLAIHHYYGTREMRGDTLNLVARPLYYERFYGEVEKLIRELAPRRQIRLNINEWGLDLPEPQQHSLLAALYGARLMNVFERRGDLVTMSAVSDLINGWPGGIIQASRHAVFVTPVYLVNQLYATRPGAERLAAKISSPAFNSSREGTSIPALDAVVSRSADGSRIFIKAVNTSQQTLQTTITLNGCEVEPQGEIETINADSLNDFNSFATPAAVTIKRATINAARSFSADLSPHSVSVITLNVSRSR